MVGKRQRQAGSLEEWRVRESGEGVCTHVLWGTELSAEDNHDGHGGAWGVGVGVCFPLLTSVLCPAPRGRMQQKAFTDYFQTLAPLSHILK